MLFLNLCIFSGKSAVWINPNPITIWVLRSIKRAPNNWTPSRVSLGRKFPLHDVHGPHVLPMLGLLFQRPLLHFSSVLAQTTGTPIGGGCSAQVGCLTLLLLENKLPQLHCNFPPVLRYPNNFLVIPDPPNKVGHYTIERLQQTLSEISGMELTVEGSGHSLDFL